MSGTIPGQQLGGNQKDLALHPTVKPVALVADAIKDVTRRGEIVLYGFGGSTTLIAAERTDVSRGWSSSTRSTVT
ncbi:MAG: DNA methyltransferase [Paracoccaceae bacterium]